MPCWGGVRRPLPLPLLWPASDGTLMGFSFSALMIRSSCCCHWGSIDFATAEDWLVTGGWPCPGPRVRTGDWEVGRVPLPFPLLPRPFPPPVLLPPLLPLEEELERWGGELDVVVRRPAVLAWF